MDQTQTTPNAPHITPNMNAEFNPSKIIGRNEPMPKRNTKILVTAIILTALLALGGGSYFAFNTTNVTADVTAATDAAVVSDAPSPVLENSTDQETTIEAATTATTGTETRAAADETMSTTASTSTTGELTLETPQTTTTPTKPVRRPRRRAAP